MALPFRSGVKCKFSSLSACVSRRLCLIVNYFYSFALKTAAFRYVMKTPSSRPFLSPPFARSSDRFRARNVSYFIFALDRVSIDQHHPPFLERCLSIACFSFPPLKHPCPFTLFFLSRLKLRILLAPVFANLRRRRQPILSSDVHTFCLFVSC